MCSFVHCETVHTCILFFFISRHVVLYVLLLCHCMLFVHMCIACLLCTWEHCVTRDIRSHASEILCACICMCVRVCDLLILLLFTFLNVFITVLRSKVQLWEVDMFLTIPTTIISLQRSPAAASLVTCWSLAPLETILAWTSRDRAVTSYWDEKAGRTRDARQVCVCARECVCVRARRAGYGYFKEVVLSCEPAIRRHLKLGSLETYP